MAQTTSLALALLLLAGGSAAWAQGHPPSGMHDMHGGHPSAPGSATAPSATQKMPDAPAMPGADTAPMDHGSMQMQGGSPPADARDPNAYSEGFERGQGLHVPDGVTRLELADQHAFGNLRVNRLERAWTRHGGNFTAYDLQGRFGRDFDHLVVKAEGEVAKGKLHDSRTELLWGHAVAPYWDTQLGVRFDKGEGKNRQWLAVGIQGLAPYWFELGATAYLGNGGRTALRLEGEYDWRLTQKLALQPRTEWTFYGKNDRENGRGKGLSTATVGMRLRYDITRQITPYVGVEWQKSFGRTGDFARAEGGRVSQTRWVAGLSFWF
ncbi:copper resistance protein B [Diaphorobacter sp. MNS-0]